jgi:hypothetical protein
MFDFKAKSKLISFDDRRSVARTIVYETAQRLGVSLVLIGSAPKVVQPQPMRAR